MSFLETNRFQPAAELVAEAVAKGVPGAVLLILHQGKVVLRQCWGYAGLRPEKRPMTCETLFDLASLTKPIATGSALALLLEARQLTLDDPVERFLPEFSQRPGITIRQLATHCAGIPAGGAYSNRYVTLNEIVGEIVRSRRAAGAGEKFIYSDYSAIALGAVVEAIAKQRLDIFCRERVFLPWAMTETTYRPGVQLAPRCAATVSGDDLPGRRGKVHDPTAAALEGAGCVSGNAGLFSTADDLGRFAQRMLEGGRGIYRPETVRSMTTPQSPLAGPEGQRGVLWDIGSAYAIRGSLSEASYGHTGFTGTSIWLVPSSGTAIILLTNAVHVAESSSKVSVIPLRRAVSTMVAKIIS
ncbi:MAG: serine hydrolase [Armatimonadetes bacterium]|nr:serine hydrolase [Armatimonadota bacterium]